MVGGLLARGIPPCQIAKIACQQWVVSERQAMRYVKTVKEQEGEQLNQPLDNRYTHLSLQLNYIYQQAIQLEDFELARKVTADRIELYKLQRKELLNDPSQTAASGLVDADELEALVRSLEEKGQTESP
jgi:hypothetical protein